MFSSFLSRITFLVLGAIMVEFSASAQQLSATRTNIYAIHDTSTRSADVTPLIGSTEVSKTSDLSQREITLPLFFTQDEQEMPFTYKGERWSFNRSKKTRMLSMYRTDNEGKTTRRQIKLSKEEWSQLFDPGFTLGALESNAFLFTEDAANMTQAMVYSICISPGPDHLAVYRNLPKRGTTDFLSPNIYRFSLTDTTATKVQLSQAFMMSIGTNHIQYDSLFIRTFISERGMTIYIYSTNNLKTPKKKIQLVAGDSISNRIIVRKSVSRLLYSRDLKKDYKNPYGRFVSTFGNSIISSFIFRDTRGDLVLGLTRFIQERSNVPMGGGGWISYKSGEKFFTLSLRINPVTLEPLDDPNGPVAD